MSSRNWHGCLEYAPNEGVAKAHGWTALGRVSHFLAAALVLLIKAYRWLISPLLGPTCRFHPSCSTYAIEAIHRYGPFGGCVRAVARLTRCHPLSDGGYDPVQ